MLRFKTCFVSTVSDRSDHSGCPCIHEICRGEKMGRLVLCFFKQRKFRLLFLVRSKMDFFNTDRFINELFDSCKDKDWLFPTEDITVEGTEMFSESSKAKDRPSKRELLKLIYSWK